MMKSKESDAKAKIGAIDAKLSDMGKNSEISEIKDTVINVEEEIAKK